MPDYIPFPNSSGGNPRQIHSDYFVGGQNIKCTVTATADNVTNSGVQATDEAQILGLGGVSLLSIEDGGTTWVDSATTNKFISRMYTSNTNAANRASDYAFMTFGTTDGTSDSSVNKITTIDGVTIDWWNKGNEATTIALLRAMTAEQFSAHVDLLTQRIKDSMDQQFNGSTFSLPALQSSKAHFIIDPEINLYDNLFINEVVTYHIQADSQASTFTNVSSNEVSNRGLYYTNSGFIPAGGSDLIGGQARLVIMAAAMLDVVNYAKGLLNHDRVSYYNMFGMFQDDVARLSAGFQNAGNTDPDNTGRVYEAIKANPDLADLNANLYTNNVKYYPGNSFAATKEVFDLCLEQAQAAWPLRTSFWFNANLRQQTNGISPGDVVFGYEDAASGKWYGLDSKYRVGDYDVIASQSAVGSERWNYPSSSGVLAYMGQRFYDLNVQGIFLFGFGINDSISEGNGIPDLILESYNNGPNTVVGPTFTFEKFDDDGYYDYYFDDLTQ